MSLTPFDYLLWSFGIALKILLCGLFFYRGLHRRLPFFAFYTVFLLIEVTILLWIYQKWGKDSYPGWFSYWFLMLMVIIVRSVIIAEICWNSLKSYPAVWSIVRKLLVVGAAAVFIFAVIRAFTARGYYILLPTEQGFEMAILIILVVLVVLAVAYHVPLPRMERSIILGLGIYLPLQVIGDSAMNKWILQYAPWWNLSRQISFDVALIIWIIPLLKPLPSLPKPPELLSERESRYLMLRTLVLMRHATRQINRLRKSLNNSNRKK